ncbi:unnamed protein product [Phytophthora fragariaefolia]|uniref:Unnamed protein product n=1 Tax=Phytophthora fragariaefolia TaxID=1490495 RepID=A0A9W6XM37_9STRA|nr:unnamed protein product [Phytophthora fragariaefolia]
MRDEKWFPPVLGGNGVIREAYLILHEAPGFALKCDQVGCGHGQHPADRGHVRRAPGLVGVHTALRVSVPPDLQRDFCDPGSQPARRGDLPAPWQRAALYAGCAARVLVWSFPRYGLHANSQGFGGRHPGQMLRRQGRDNGSSRDDSNWLGKQTEARVRNEAQRCHCYPDVSLFPSQPLFTREPDNIDAVVHPFQYLWGAIHAVDWRHLDSSAMPRLSSLAQTVEDSESSRRQNLLPISLLRDYRETACQRTRGHLQMFAAGASGLAQAMTDDRSLLVLAG